MYALFDKVALHILNGHCYIFEDEIQYVVPYNTSCMSPAVMSPAVMLPTVINTPLISLLIVSLFTYCEVILFQFLCFFLDNNSFMYASLTG